MRLAIDNMDGLGAVDYTDALSSTEPLTIRRELNAVTECAGAVCLHEGFAVPVRRARVIVQDGAGNALFTGYIVSEAMPVFDEIAERDTASVYRFIAKSDEWLLDLETMADAPGALRTTAGAVTQQIVRQSGMANVLDARGATLATPVCRFTPERGRSITENLGAVLSEAYAGYRVLGGSFALTQLGSVTHDLHEAEGGGPIDLRFDPARELANDITVAGEREATTYVTEVFSGDGATQTFTLTQRPFVPFTEALVDDAFTDASVNPRLWKQVGTHLAPGGDGLLLSGGTGVDGETVLQLQEAVEMGGTLVAYAENVLLDAASDGVLCGFYNGSVAIGSCVAGVRIRQSSGATIAFPLLNGVESGVAMSVQPGHRYTFRVRLHAQETQRVLQTYFARAGGAVTAFGGGDVDAALRVVVEAQDLGLASSTAATILYDGMLPASPAACLFAAVNGAQLFGSIGRVRVEPAGSSWVTVRHADETETTQLLGVLGDGVDASLTNNGVLTFYAGRVPAPGEQLIVRYRASGRSVARVQNTASVIDDSSSGLPSVARWCGSVASPAARSSADCESAAAAILAGSASREAAMRGRCIAQNLQQVADVWPGDLLQVETGSGMAQGMARRVTLTDGNALPEAIEYVMDFANDWAQPIGIRTSASVPEEALLPQLPRDASAAPIASLPEMKLVSASGTELSIDAGTAAPGGGGFEVRRSDGHFGSGAGADLVLQTPVRGFSIPRSAQVERFYIRMYDGSTPPRYSRFSSAVFVNVPMG
jgi:hypothetical protein